MKKKTFYKMMAGNKIEKAEGYQQYYNIPGTDIEISLCFDKRPFDWAITEESSGMLIRRNFKTRKAAESSVNINMLKAIHKRLPSVNHYITMLNIHRGRVCEL